jgi:hypothetical protein
MHGHDKKVHKRKKNCPTNCPNLELGALAEVRVLSDDGPELIISHTQLFGRDVLDLAETMVHSKK